MKRNSLVLLLLCFSLFAHSLMAMELKLFEKHTYQQLLSDYNKQAFILILWSIDCPPCYDELILLGKYLSHHPNKKMIFVATDSRQYENDIRKMLTTTLLQSQPLYIFSDVPEQHLRYTIDPHWYGELPRSYLFDACHNRKAISGKMTWKMLDDFYVRTSLKHEKCP
jgi:thiol-disulfide isomerase/thioredoxin